MFKLNCPWLVLLRRRHNKSSTVQHLHFMGGILGRVLVQTVLFDASGDALNKGSDERCKTDGVFEELAAVIISSIVSLIVSSPPGIVAASLHERHFVVGTSLRSSAWKRQLRIWRCKATASVLLAIVYTVAAIVIVLVFLANVAPWSGSKWIEATVIPLGMGIAYMVIALICVYTLHFCSAPHASGSADCSKVRDCCSVCPTPSAGPGYSAADCNRASSELSSLESVVVHCTVHDRFVACRLAAEGASTVLPGSHGIKHL